MDYWFVVIISFLLSGAASLYVKSTYNKFDSRYVSSGMNSSGFVSWIFSRAGISDVIIGRTEGSLTDNYNPESRILSLSDSTYGNSSVAAIGVAAHEAGHAVQHHVGFSLVKLRSAMVPVVNIGSNLGLVLAIIGSFISSGISYTLIEMGIILYSLTFVFTLVTLPVEINASRRAMGYVRESNMFTDEEQAGMRKVLTAAALTYVASMVVALLNLLRIISVFSGGRSRRN